MKTFQVEAKLKNPGCYNSGYSYTIRAANKAEAIKTARRYVGNDGHTRQDGALSYTATETEY